MINYSDLNLNAFGNNLFEVRKNYLNVMKGTDQGSGDLDLLGDYIVEEITMVTVEGNSQFYMMFKDLDEIFIADITVNSYLPFIKVGDKVSVASFGNTINSIIKVESK